MRHDLLNVFLTSLWARGLTSESKDLEIQSVFQPHFVHDTNKLHCNHVLSQVIAHLSNQTIYYEVLMSTVRIRTGLRSWKRCFIGFPSHQTCGLMGWKTSCRSFRIFLTEGTVRHVWDVFFGKEGSQRGELKNASFENVTGSGFHPLHSTSLFSGFDDIDRKLETAGDPITERQDLFPNLQSNILKQLEFLSTRHVLDLPLSTKA